MICEGLNCKQEAVVEVVHRDKDIFNFCTNHRILCETLWKTAKVRTIE